MKLNSSQNCSSNGQAAKLEPFAATLIILYIHECNLYDTQLAVTIIIQCTSLEFMSNKMVQKETEYNVYSSCY